MPALSVLLCDPLRCTADALELYHAVNPQSASEPYGYFDGQGLRPEEPQTRQAPASAPALDARADIAAARLA